ncbi:MAG: hypothetical protein MST10_00425 [Lentisphaeria bacterium]|nr:hypothetical protein [Lentisphaeria bacterium]
MKRNGITATFLATVLMALFAAGSMLHILCHQADYVYERLTGQYLVNLENGENSPPDSMVRTTENCSGDILQEHFCQLCSQVNPLSWIDTPELLPVDLKLVNFARSETSGQGGVSIQVIQPRAPPESLI